MAPTTPMTVGYAYVFDYITDTADGDNQELNGKTLGTDYCRIPIDFARGSGDQEAELIYYPLGKGYFFRYNQDEGNVTIGNNKMSKTDFKAVKQYWKKHRDNDADPDYLIIYFGANDFYPFHDEDGNEKDYLRGLFKRKPYEGWSSDAANMYGIHLEFKEVWD